MEYLVQQPLRICFILDTPNLSTGVPTAGLPARIVSLAKSLQNAGAEISFVLGDRGMTMDALASWNFRSLLVNPNYLYGAPELLSPYIQQLNPNFIVIADAKLTATNGRLWARQIGARLVYEAHDDEAQLARDRGDSDAAIRNFADWQAAAAKGADFVTVLTRREEQMMINFGITQERILVAPIGIELSERTTWGPDLQAKRLLMIGNLFYEPNAIAARFIVGLVQQLNERGCAITARIIGRGPDDLLHCDAPNVEFCGAVPELDPHMSGSTLALAPIAFGSGQKKKLLDFLAAGLPVLATSEAVNGYPTGHPGVVINDHLDSWADTIERLINNEAELQQMGVAGRDSLFPAYDAAFIAEQVLIRYRTWLHSPLRRSDVQLPEGSMESTWLLEHASKQGLGAACLTKEQPVLAISGKSPVIREHPCTNLVLQKPGSYGFDHKRDLVTL